MIRMTNVEKTYENGTHALNGISFEIQDGEFVFLVGPSGSGKSTIIKLLTGELVPSRALVNNPSTIVADEPTGNLDPARSLEIMTLLERINALGTTVVVVTHEKSLVNHFDKRVIMIDHGVVAATGVGRYEVAAHA